MKEAIADFVVRLERPFRWTLPIAVCAAIGGLYINKSEVERYDIVGGVIFFNPGRDGGAAPASTFPLLASKYDRVLVFPSSGPEYEAIHEQASRALGRELPEHHWIGVFEHEGGRLEVGASDEVLFAALDQVKAEESDSSPLRSAIVVSILAMGGGVLLARWQAEHGRAYLVLCAGLLAALFVTRCKTCNTTDSLLGVDRSALGAALYALVFGASLSVAAPRLGALVSAVACLSSSYQIYLFAIAENTCYWCLAVLALSSIVVGKSLAGTRPSLVGERATASLPRAWLIAASAASFVFAGALIVGGLQAPDGTPAFRWSLQPKPSRFDSELNGTSVKDWGVRTADGRPFEVRNSVLLAGSDECAACQWAVRAALGWNDVSVVIAAPSRSRLQAAGPFSHYYCENAPSSLGLPLLVAVDSSGMIVAHVAGWADDPRANAYRHDQLRHALEGQP